MSASSRYGGFFEYDLKKERFEEVARELEDPGVWSNPARAQELGRERARLAGAVGEIDRTTKGVADAAELLELAEAENDERRPRATSSATPSAWRPMCATWNCKRMFRGEMDSHNAFLDIRPVPAAPRRRTGHRCCCACICGGPPRVASAPR